MDRPPLHHWQLPLAVAAVAFLSSCTTRADAVVHGGSENVRTVAVERVTRQDLGRSLELAAEFRPNQEIDLHAKIAGYLKAIYVHVGDHVVKGQLIAELEAPEMTQELAQAEATLKRSEVDVDRARSELRRSEAQHSIRQVSFERLSAVIKARPNLVARQEIDDASARLREAEAQLSVSQAAISGSEEQVRIAAAGKERFDTMLAYLRITAPFAGTITKRLADPGAMIQAGTASRVQAMPVVQLSQVDHLRLVLPVPESVVPSIRTGTPVEVRVESLKRVFQGRISRFSGKLDSATRTMETEVDLANPDSVIKPGMFGYATLVLEHRLDALTVPVQAFSGRSASPTVMVVGADKRLEERPVHLGLETPGLIEVLSGLREHEMVVVGARANLRPGLLVEPKLQDPTARGAAR
ncbi:MAG: efflux RND transporter periplasmic adaptor subunit [Gemmatimonadaceae bacterium]